MQTTDDWCVSGLCVTARADRMAAVEEIIGQLPGFEVHARDATTGRLVVVQERATVEEHRRGLRELQALPGVLTAELVLHYRNVGDHLDCATTGGSS